MKANPDLASILIDRNLDSPGVQSRLLGVDIEKWDLACLREQDDSSS